MRHFLLATVLVGAMAFSGAAAAQSLWDEKPVGKEAGAFMMRARAIGVIPLNSSSSISVIGGKVDVSNTAAPELDFSYFLTDNIALELIAATTQHNIYAKGSALSSGSYYVGNTWVLPPTLLLQYHFMPHERFSPYVGAGLNVTFFYNSSAPGAGTSAVTSLGLSNNVGAAVQVGFDYNFAGRWFANVDFKQIFVNTEASINGGAIKAKTSLNPMVIGAGIGYRF